MKTKFTLLSLATLIAGSGAAATLSPGQALERASFSAEGKKLVNAAATPTLVHTVKDTSGQPAVYVFNNADNGGVLLLSADDVAMPVLGYTDEGNFNPSDVPVVVESWLKEYARQIEYAKEHGVETTINPKMDYPSSWSPISILLSTKWDQGTPFNDQTPVSGSRHTPTGCVATAMAQVMKYWNYPEIGEGSVTYYMGNDKLSMTFGRTPFEWNNMLDAYVSGQYTQAQADAVSYLMKACGYSSEMNYELGGSGTQTSLAGMALVNYFKYDNSIKYDMRVFYSDTEWAGMVYNELKSRRPVVYDGSSRAGGHAFVIDGYDGNGYFHVNWGWGGMCNGYYLLTALTPSQQGTGGFEGGYNFNQGMLYNIKKSENNSKSLQGYISMFGNLSATATGATLTFTLTDWNDPQPGFFNQSLSAFQPTFGIAVQKADGSGSVTFVQGTQYGQPIQTGRYLASESFKPTAGFPTSLGDGKYKVTLIYKSGSGSNSEWKYFRPVTGMHDYVYVTKNGGTLSVENLAMNKYSITDAKILTPLYLGYPCQIEFSITNPTDQELTQTIIPTLSIDGTVYFEGDNQIVAIGPNQTVKKTIVYAFTSIKSGQTPSTVSPKEFTLGAYDYNTGMNYGSYGNVTMYRSGTSNPTVQLDALKVTNAAGEEKDWISIENYADMVVEVSLTVTSNNSFLASPLTCVVYEALDNGNDGAEVYEKEFENYVYLGSGDSATEKTTLGFNNGDPWKIYNLAVYYVNNSRRVLIGSLKFTSTGVESVTSQEDTLRLECIGNVVYAYAYAGIASIEVYDINGARIAASRDELIDISGLGSGLYIVCATDNTGTTATLKLTK